MPKFTGSERMLIQNLVCNLSIKRIPDNEIIKEVYEQTKKTISKVTLFNIRKRIKTDSYKWNSQLREGEYEYIHEFKERINEIMWLQKKHHEIIDSPNESTASKQSSLAELHRLNITLSNYFDVAPSIVYGITLSTAPESKTTGKERANREEHIIV